MLFHDGEPKIRVSGQLEATGQCEKVLRAVTHRPQRTHHVTDICALDEKRTRKRPICLVHCFMPALATTCLAEVIFQIIQLLHVVKVETHVRC